MSHEANEYQPQLLEEAERLLGGQFFPDGNPFDSPEAAGEELGYKRFIYTGCCRFIAESRREDRALASKQPGYNPREWNGSWADQKMTTKGIDAIAFSHHEEVTFKSRQLALITNAVRYAKQHQEALDAKLFEDQRPYPRGIIAALQKSPQTVRYSDALGHPQHSEVHGVTAIAPTGSGKSHILMASAAMLSVGKSIEGTKHGKRPARMLLTVPSRALQNQWARTLQAEFPNLHVGVMSGDKREPSADIVVSTIRMYTNYFRDKHIDGHPVDISAFDEGHHLNEPLMRQTFLGQAQTGITLNFTATPAYDLRRDVRALIPRTIEYNDIMSLIEKGRLNHAQIFTFLIDRAVYKTLVKRYNLKPSTVGEQAIIQEAIHQLTLEFTAPLLEEGRRGIIFCKQGNRADYSKQLAALFNGLELSDGRLVRAVSMNSYDNNQDEIMRDYRASKIDIITTIDMARQGINLPFDFVLNTSNIKSRLRGHQITGRGTPRSERFKVTIYGEFFNTTMKSLEDITRLYSMQEAFSGNRILKEGRLRDTAITPQRKERSDGIDIGQFSDLIQNLIRIGRRPIGETDTRNNPHESLLKQGLKPLSSIAKKYDVPERTIRKLLRKAGHTWTGRYEERTGTKQLIHYYDPVAQTYLEQTLFQHRLRTLSEVATHFNVSEHLIGSIINNPEHAITGRADNRRTIPSVRYGTAELNKIEAVLKTIPGTQPGDTNLTNLAQELGLPPIAILELAGLQGVKRRRIKGAYPVTAAEASRIKTIHEASLAQSEAKNIAAIAKAAGVSSSFVSRNLTNEELTAATRKRYKNARGHHRSTTVWEADQANAIVERMKKFQQRKLPAHLLPMTSLRKLVSYYSQLSPKETKELLGKGNFTPEEMVIASAPGTTHTSRISSCISWQAVAYLQKTRGKLRTKDVIDIDFSRLPAGPDDLDPEKIAYAQEIQRQFIAAERLERYDVEWKAEESKPDHGGENEADERT